MVVVVGTNLCNCRNLPIKANLKTIEKKLCFCKMDAMAMLPGLKSCAHDCGGINLCKNEKVISTRTLNFFEELVSFIEHF